MEAGENSTLRLRGEVDERVATDQQIEPRDRRVLGEVVPPEDDRPPECGAKDKSLTLAIEKPFLEVRVERPQLLGGVARARLAQGLLVDVGGIHLDAVEVRLLPHFLAEQDRGRVSLLAGGRAGAPNANVAGPGDDPGDDVLG